MPQHLCPLAPDPTAQVCCIHLALGCKFRGPRFGEDGKKTENTRFTVWLNGVPVHDDVEQPSGTGAGKRIGEGPNPLPTKLQNHSNPVRFRNIWLVETGRAKTQSTKSLAKIHTTNPEIAAILKSIGYLK